MSNYSYVSNESEITSVATVCEEKCGLFHQATVPLTVQLTLKLSIPF